MVEARKIRKSATVNTYKDIAITAMSEFWMLKATVLKLQKDQILTTL